MGTICSVHWIHFIMHVGVHDYNTTYSVDVECVEHYTEYGFTTQCTHNEKFISITYDWYDCTSTLQCNTSVQQLIAYF